MGLHSGNEAADWSGYPIDGMQDAEGQEDPYRKAAHLKTLQKGTSLFSLSSARSKSKAILVEEQIDCKEQSVGAIAYAFYACSFLATGS